MARGLYTELAEAMTLPRDGPVGLAVRAGADNETLGEGDGHLVHVKVAESAEAGAAAVELDCLRLALCVPSNIEWEGGVRGR